MTRMLLYIILLLSVIFSQSLNAQTPDKILFGTYIASSNDQKITFHQFGDSNLVKLGFNSIFQTVIHDSIYAPLRNLDPVKWKDNRDSLTGSTFENIMALNSIWNVADPTEKQADWLNILSQGVYNVWEAEGGSDGFYSNIIKMRRNNTYTTLETDAGGIYVKSKDISWSPGSGISDSNYQEGRVEIELLEGPFVYQDRDYKITYLLGSPNGALIQYLANFKLKIGARPDSNMTVCSLRVNLNITDTAGIKYTVEVANREVKSDELSDEFFTLIEMRYNFGLISRSYFIESGKIDPKTISAVNTSYEVVLPENIYSTDFGELYIDNIEVMDELIWYNHGRNPANISRLLNNYNTTWQNADNGNVYGDKIKYFYTMDEPHSYDHFLPYKIVEDVHSTLTNPLKDKVMLTKMYPEWNGEKEGLNVLDTWGKVVKPKKFMFWYYTIFNEDFDTQLMQHQLRDRLIEAVKHDRDFYFTAQTWGNKKLNDPEYLYYKSPSGAEILGQTIMPLAFGCKGIFYETYYTYISNNILWGGDYLVEGLVGTDGANNKTPRPNDRGLYEMVGNIGRRLKGELGKTLVKLNYADWSSYVHRISRDHGLTRNGKDLTGGSTNRVEIFDGSELTYPNDKWYSFGVTRLQRKIPVPPYEDFYFFYNANTFMDGDTTEYSHYTDFIKIGLKSFPKKNIRFYNVEGGEYYNFTQNLDSNYSVKFEMRINKGDGKLFRLTATVASEGVLQTDEDILPDEIISSEGTITVPEGVTLKIEGNYTLKDSLIIEDGGVLTLEPGSTLNLDSASSVYCTGDIYVNGTETNKVTINFLQPNESKQNSIYLGRESSAIIKYAQIKNGYSGVTATNGFDTLIIDNCNFTNISHSALLLNGNGYDNAKIKNNTYTNCDYAGFFSNLATVAVNSDSANTTSGYYFSGIEYALPKDGLVSIKLFDITGRLVKQLVKEQKPSGRHKTTIESGNLASGIYIYSLRVNDININKKLVILK